MSDDQEKLRKKIEDSGGSSSSSRPPRKPVPQPPPVDDDLPPPYEAPQAPPKNSSSPPRKPVPQLPTIDDDLPPPYEAPQAPARNSSSPPRKPVPQLPTIDDDLPPPPSEPPPPPPPGESAFRRVAPSPEVAPGGARLGSARLQTRERGVVVLQRQHLGASSDWLSTVNFYLKAQLVWPVVEHKQYVNLTQEGTSLSIEGGDARKRGHKITVKTKLIEGKRGNQVYVKLKYGADNSKRNNPKPGIEGGLVADWCPEGGIIVPMRADDEQPNCEATFNLELGYAGGDEVTVHVGGNKKCEDDQVKIINWRKIGFQITKPASMEIPSLQIADEALRDVFIELEKLSEVNLRHKDGPPGSWVGAVATPDGKGWLKDGELIIGDHNRAEFQKKFKFAGEKDPIAHLIFCHKQYDGGAPGKWKTAYLETGGVAEKEPEKRLPHATKPTFTLKITEKMMSILNPAIQDGNHPFVSGAWSTRAPIGHPDNPGKGLMKKMGILTAANVAIDSDGRSVTVTLPPEAAQIVGNGKDIKDKKHPIKAAVVIRVAKGPYEGESDGEHMLIVGVGDVLIDLAKKVSGTICHEVGHSFNQAVQGGKAPPGLRYLDHKRSYNGKGHQGQHCAEGLTDSQFSKPDYESALLAVFKPKCLMWGDVSPMVLPWKGVLFCERCRPYLIAEHCTALK